jgi:hypothetical protein
MNEVVATELLGLLLVLGWGVTLSILTSPE